MSVGTGLLVTSLILNSITSISPPLWSSCVWPEPLFRTSASGVTDRESARTIIWSSWSICIFLIWPLRSCVLPPYVCMQLAFWLSDASACSDVFSIFETFSTYAESPIVLRPAWADTTVVPKAGPSKSSYFASASHMNCMGLVSGYSSNANGDGAASTVLLFLFSLIVMMLLLF